MPTFKLTLAYDGTGLVGWQRQASGVSVQGVMEDALSAIAGTAVVVHGSGRTDAGVHAAAQVASTTLETRLAPATLVRALNAHLPASVRVTAAEEVAPSFHARFSARAKTYRYAIWNGTAVSPFAVRSVWHVPIRLDSAAMAEAAAAFLGRRDFAAVQSSGSSVASAVRTISASRLLEWSGEDRPLIPGVAVLDPGCRLLVFEVTADGFLRHMVRTLAGTLVEVGGGRRTASETARMLEGRDRRLAGATAPASGLWLMRVEY